MWRSAGQLSACQQRAKTLRWARGREGCSDSPLPTSGLHPPRNATTATAASGGNREQLLGQRPARRECRPRHEADAGCRNPEAAEAIPNRPASKKAAAKWQAFGGSCAAHGDAAAQWTFCAIYDFSVKKTAAGLIFWPFSCKLKGNHARVFFARQNPAKRATYGIKNAKNNGA